MGHISENILSLRQELPSGVELVAVSKFKSGEEILEAYEAGQRVFGESRPQELKEKALSLPREPSPGTQGEGPLPAQGY